MANCRWNIHATQKGKERLELEKERMQKQIILFMKKDYEDEI